MIRRRKFVAGLGVAAVAWPLAARAQPTMPAPPYGVVSATSSAWVYFRKTVYFPLAYFTPA